MKLLFRLGIGTIGKYLSLRLIEVLQILRRTTSVITRTLVRTFALAKEHVGLTSIGSLASILALLVVWWQSTDTPTTVVIETPVPSAAAAPVPPRDYDLSLGFRPSVMGFEENTTGRRVVLTADGLSRTVTGLHAYVGHPDQLRIEDPECVGAFKGGEAFGPLVAPQGSIVGCVLVSGATGVVAGDVLQFAFRRIGPLDEKHTIQFRFEEPYGTWLVDGGSQVLPINTGELFIAPARGVDRVGITYSSAGAKVFDETVQAGGALAFDEDSLFTILVYGGDGTPRTFFEVVSPDGTARNDTGGGSYFVFENNSQVGQYQARVDGGSWYGWEMSAVNR